MYVSISEGLFQMHFEKRTINLIKFGFTWIKSKIWCQIFQGQV